MSKRKSFRISLSLFVLISISLSFMEGQNVYAEKSSRHVSNEILVRFKEGVDESSKEFIRENLGATLIKTIKSIRVEHWKLSEDVSVEQALDFLKTLPDVEYAEPNMLYKPLTIPNDTDMNRLWYLHNTGQQVNGKIGLVGADISAEKAWDLETGNRDIVIAVIDSGVAYDHPDLKNNVWTNENEIPDNGIDDDNNGFIDDVHGWDFVNNDNNPSDYSTDCYGDGHGTHVAGIIAAQGNNGIGISGIMWSAQIMPLQIFDLFQIDSFENSIIQLVNIVSAITYAVENNANIVNCSFGSYLFSQFIYDALNLANQKGVLVIAAAGNDNINNDQLPKYPASYNLPNIISVAATNEKDEISSYSNYGMQSVDVAAPGGSVSNGKANIYSTTPPEREVLFYDDFEDGGSKWMTYGIYESWGIGYDPIFGSKTAQDSIYSYHVNESSNFRTKNPIDARNCKGLHFQFLIDYSLEDGYDYLYIEGSEDNINYETAYFATGFSNGIVPVFEWANDIDLGEFYLRFRLESDYSGNYDGVYIDDILLTGVRWQFDGDEYGYKSGTSMAAPVVSGIAGLIWSYQPNLTHLEVKEAILNSVDKKDTLSGKVYTGGRVNAYKALLYSGLSNDNCPNDPQKTEPGICGCGVADTDADNDGTSDCNDYCPDDYQKITPGICGCGVSDIDSDGNGIPDCNDADKQEDIGAFVTRFYQLCLDRNPDSAGLNGWVVALSNGTQTGSDVANGFVFSQEFMNKSTANEEYLQILYQAFFNRPPDTAGLNGWLDTMASGASREAVLNGFIYAQEFANLCDAYGIKATKVNDPETPQDPIKAFVTRFYQLCLDRNPDPSGLEGWTNNLINQIQTGADVANGFIFSQEFIHKNTTDGEYLTILYKAFFNRDPDQAGFNLWIAELNGGKDRSFVLDGFLGSQEFMNLCEGYGIAPL